MSFLSSVNEKRISLYRSKRYSVPGGISSCFFFLMKPILTSESLCSLFVPPLELADKPLNWSAIYSIRAFIFLLRIVLSQMSEQQQLHRFEGCLILLGNLQSYRRLPLQKQALFVAQSYYPVNR